MSRAVTDGISSQFVDSEHHFHGPVPGHAAGGRAATHRLAQPSQGIGVELPVVRDEPYRLAADVWGIGFKTADTTAAVVGIARDSPERIKAGLAYTLSEAADEGHSYLPALNLMTDAAKILEVPAGLITPCLDELAAAEGVVREEVPAPAGTASRVPAVYLPPFFMAERSLASALLRLLAARADRLAAFREVDWDKALAWLRGRTGAPKGDPFDRQVRGSGIMSGSCRCWGSPPGD